MGRLAGLYSVDIERYVADRENLLGIRREQRYGSIRRKKARKQIVAMITGIDMLDYKIATRGNGKNPGQHLQLLTGWLKPIGLISFITNYLYGVTTVQASIVLLRGLLSLECSAEVIIYLLLTKFIENSKTIPPIINNWDVFTDYLWLKKLCHVGPKCKSQSQ